MATNVAHGKCDFENHKNQPLITQPHDAHHGSYFNKTKSVKYFKCLGIEHIASECSNWQVVNLIEEFSKPSDVRVEEPPLYDDYNDNNNDDVLKSLVVIMVRR